MGRLPHQVLREHYTRRLFFTSILLAFSSANYSFDNQGFAQTQAMDPFLRRFGDKGPNGKYTLPSTFLSYSNAFPFLVLLCGIAVGSEVSSRFGRRMTVFCMSIWAMCCVPIMITSKHRNQILAARCLNSLYIGMEMSVIPVYQSEIVPPAVRGLAVTSYQLSFGVGAFIISGVCHRTSTIKNDWSWRIPFLCYLFVPFVVSSLIWFQPESPRWLASKGRLESARRSLTIFRKGDADIEAELEMILATLKLEEERKQGSYKSCFQGTNLRRTFIVIVTNIFLQATGSPFTALYGPLIVKQLNSISPFTYTLISATINLVAYIVGSFSNDILGRRPIMLGGTAFQAVCIFLVAGLGTPHSPNDAMRAAIVVFIALYSMGFCIGWASSSYLISAEVPSQRLRDKTSRMGFVTGVIVQFVVALVLPYIIFAPSYLGMKVGYTFGPICILAFIWGYFFLPECKGLSLEQVDLMFEERVPGWRSPKWNKEHRGRVIEERIFEEVADTKQEERIETRQVD